MPTPISIWYKVSYEYVIYSAAGPRLQAFAYSSYDDLAPYAYVNQYNNAHRAAFNAISMGASIFTYSPGNTLVAATFGMTSHTEPYPNYPGNYYQVVDNTTYALVRATITEIVYSPASPPGGPIPLISVSIGNTNTGLNTIPSSSSISTASQYSYQWYQGTVYERFDANGDGIDDRGQSQGAAYDQLRAALDAAYTAQYNALPPIAFLPTPPAPSEAAPDVLNDLSQIIADLSERYARSIGQISQADLLKALGRLASAVGLVGDVVGAYDRISTSGNPRRQAWIEFNDLAAQAVVSRVPIVGGIIYTTTLQSTVRDFAAQNWDARHPSTLPLDEKFFDFMASAEGGPDALAPAFDYLQQILSNAQTFDPVWYLAQYPVAATALLDGTSSSAIAHYLTIGAGLGYLPRAGASPIAPGSIVSMYAANDPASGGRQDAWFRTLGSYVGDGASAAESAFATLIDGQQAASVVHDRNLAAVANRLAIDLVYNREAAPQVLQTRGVNLEQLAFGAGPTLANAFPQANLTNVAMFVLATPGLQANEAFAQMMLRPQVSALVNGTAISAVGIAEYGGVWVLLVASGARTTVTAPAEAASTQIHYGSGGNDSLYAGERVSRLYGLDGDDQLLGSRFADQLFGGAGSDSLDGNFGDDLIVGGGGSDILAGRDGRDVFRYVEISDSPVGQSDLITDFESGRDRIDFGQLGLWRSEVTQSGGRYLITGYGPTGTIQITSLSYLLASDVDLGTAGVRFVGTGNADIVTGSETVDYLQGLAGNDVLRGLGGADLIEGGDGNDALLGEGGNDILDGGLGANSISGGAGSDTLIVSGGGNELQGGTGDDIYVVVGRTDTIIEYANEGTDELSTTSFIYDLNSANNVENLTFTDNAAHAGVGNALANLLVAGTAADELQGRGGNDVLRGGTGAANTLLGGTGDDLYVVEASGDTVIEYANEGIDTVQTALSVFYLRDNVENLIYTGSGTFSGVGNADNNMMTAGAGADFLNGNDGDDILIGGSGADLLIGGNGADQFRYLGGESGYDRIIDFTAGADKIALASSGFTRTATLAFVSGAGAAANSANSTFLYDTNTGILSYDADGNGAGAAVQLAQLNTGLTLSLGDFVFV